MKKKIVIGMLLQKYNNAMFVNYNNDLDHYIDVIYM